MPGEVRCPFCRAVPELSAGPAPTFQLQWIDPWGQPWRWAIPPTGLYLGRDSRNDIVISDVLVSRHHALLWVSGGQAYVLDWDSTNGTWVNEQRIAGPYPLQVGDRLRIGEVTFALVRGLPAVPSVVPETYASPSFIPAARLAAPVPQVARPAGLTAGHPFLFAGALVVLVMFFLPWIHLAGLGIFQRYSAFEMVRMDQSLGLGEAANLVGLAPPVFPMPLYLLILCPLAALFSLSLAAFGLLLKPRQRWGVPLAQFVAILPAAFIQVWFLASLPAFQSRLLLLSVTLDTNLALWCSLAGTTLIFLGSILDVALEFPISRS